MKIEYTLLRSVECIVPFSCDVYRKNEYGIYISKNEIIKNYENNKELLIDKLDHLAEMLTTPYCFNTMYWYKDYEFKNGYDYEKVSDIVTIMRKSTTKGLLLYVDGNEYKKNFIVEIIKK